MTRHVVAEVESFTDQEIRRVEVAGKGICLVRQGEIFYALADRCPHGGARLSGGRLAHRLNSSGPGDYRVCGHDTLLKCPWHGWEFELATGRSWSDPKATRTRAFCAHAVAGNDLKQGPYEAETIAVEVEGNYVVIEL